MNGWVPCYSLAAPSPLAPRTPHPPLTIDVNALIGPFAFRDVPHPEPDVLVRVLAREGLAGAWVGHLPSVYWRDPEPGNELLREALAGHAPVLREVPCIRPDWPHWERALRDAAERGVPAIRAYPPQWGLGAGDPRLLSLAHGCAEHGLVLLLTVRFEDVRQRHSLDVAGDLPAATVRALLRANDRVHVIVTAAGRELVEETHWGLTPDERGRLWWDISWIWGPPEDHLAHLLRTVGADRFLFGTQWPLRLTQSPRANLALLPDELGTANLSDARAVEASARKRRE